MTERAQKKFASIHFAKQMRSHQTDAEKKLWHELRAKRFENFKFRRQQIIGPYIADFICPARKLIIEADGMHHNVDQDALRDSYLRSLGYRVMRFSNHDITRNFPMVADNIWVALHDANFDPCGEIPLSRPRYARAPSPSRGEGK